MIDERALRSFLESVVDEVESLVSDHYQAQDVNYFGDVRTRLSRLLEDVFEEDGLGIDDANLVEHTETQRLAWERGPAG